MKVTAKKALSMTLRMARGTATAMGLAVMLAVVLGVGTTALAAAPGDPFKLGKVNVVNAVSKLAGTTNDALLKVDNNSGGPNATALDLQVEQGKPPMKVNSETMVTNLNSDKLDGKSSSAFFSTGRTYLVRNTVDGPGGGQVVLLSASCDDGDPVLGGGGGVSGDSFFEDPLLVSAPLNGSLGWRITLRDNNDAASSFIVDAICADFPPLRP